jgi:hypothetical protein
LVKRNPNLLSVPTTGYGSAEGADKETIYLSYVIAYTRPIGGILLFTLFGLLLTPFFKQLL